MKKGYSGIYGLHKYWGKKSPELYGEILRNLGKPGDVVVDPFMGSGVLARVCKDHGIHFRGSDLNPSAVSIAEIFVSPPTSQQVLDALAKISHYAESKIRRMYTNSQGVEASHFVRQNKNILEVWIRKGRKIVLGNTADWNGAEYNHADCYTPRCFEDRLLLKNSRINVNQNDKVSSLFSSRALQGIDLILEGIANLSEKEKKISKFILTSSLGQMSNMVFAITRRKPGAKRPNDHRQYEVGSWVIGYWKPKINVEVNVWNVFDGRARKFASAVRKEQARKQLSFLTGKRKEPFIELRKKDAFDFLKDIPNSSVDLVITDPPHSDRIPYLELSEMWNTITGEYADYKKEWVFSNAAKRDKNEQQFNSKIRDLLLGVSNILKERAHFILMFNTTSSQFWMNLKQVIDSQETALCYEGKFPAPYSALSVVQDSREGALQHDWCLLFTKAKMVTPNYYGFEGWSDQWID